jgi:hypothetical protein
MSTEPSQRNAENFVKTSQLFTKKSERKYDEEFADSDAECCSDDSGYDWSCAM